MFPVLWRVPQCYTNEWAYVAIYAIVMAIVYVIGLPVVVFVLLFRRRHELFKGPTSAAVKEQYGFLYVVYGPSAWWWEVEELVRKLCLSSIVVLIDPSSPLAVSMQQRFSTMVAPIPSRKSSIFTVLDLVSVGASEPVTPDSDITMPPLCTNVTLAPDPGR